MHHLLIVNPRIFHPYHRLSDLSLNRLYLFSFITEKMSIVGNSSTTQRKVLTGTNFGFNSLDHFTVAISFSWSSWWIVDRPSKLVESHSTSSTFCIKDLPYLAEIWVCLFNNLQNLWSHTFCIAVFFWLIWSMKTSNISVYNHSTLMFHIII